MRRRTNPAIPTRPVANRERAPGSGTAVIGVLEANPVFGPQPAPDAVQKWTATPVNSLAERPDALSTHQ